jgi:two-component system, chemotaxis family, protein-glutamate methylesterase/glutaminase
VKRRVLIIDDSALMRQLLQAILSRDPELEVVGTAADAIIAHEKIRSLKPDVLTLDVEMPRMDGLTFLSQLMSTTPMPVVMVSSLTEAGCETTLKALELGAFDFVTKPKLDLATKTLPIAEILIEKVKVAASSKARTLQRPVLSKFTQASAPAAPIPFANILVAIGASTGGTEAIKDVLMPLPANFPGIVIVQHMPETFTAKFAHRLDSLCHMKVREAHDGDLVEPGLVLIAPGGKQLQVVRRGSSAAAVKVFDGERTNLHRPSVDVLFESCSSLFGAHALGVLLTGMGADGANGLLAMRRTGAHTIAQDETTCVVFGMPRAAIGLGAAELVLPLGKIGPHLTNRLKRPAALAS